MRLKYIHISHYKNLADFKLSFDGESFIDIFVGKNGTGKSNLFEALIEIFRHLYEYDKTKEELTFDYQIIFGIDGKETDISWSTDTFIINGKERKTIKGVPLPDNVLIYYSGHNTTVANLINQYEDAFRSRIKNAGFDESRCFIGIGPDYKGILLALLLMQEGNNTAKRFVCEKLGVENVGDEIKVALKRPSYADDNKAFDIKDQEADAYWKPEGVTKAFLDRLTNCISVSGDSPVRSEGYFEKNDHYILYFDIAHLREEFKDYSAEDLFRQFDNLKTLGMLAEISIPLTLVGGEEASLAHFSDGQFQSIYIYATSELFKDRNCITLLDEPDSFLHPEWQFDFLKQVFEITDAAARSNHVLMSSHSAVTLIPYYKKQIKFFDIKDNSANCYSLPKGIAIKKLSSDLIQYSEQENLLSIINTIQIENKPVLFTEGSTDPIILKEAWRKLYDDEMPFIPFYAFSCTYINQLLTDNRIHGEMGGLPVFALFDFDEAYNQWNGLNGDVIEMNPLQGMVKKWAGGESYAIMLPVPGNADIQNQVIKNSATNETFAHQSLCEIEHLFYGPKMTKDYFKLEPCPGGNKIAFACDDQKTTFAQKVVPLLDSECFEVFRPVFEFIKSKCPVRDEAAAE